MDEVKYLRNKCKLNEIERDKLVQKINELQVNLSKKFNLVKHFPVWPRPKLTYFGVHVGF